MTLEHDLFCSATVTIAIPPEETFAYMADGIRTGEWTLGSWNRRDLGDGLYVGKSLFDGTETFVRIYPDHERLTIDYASGNSPESLRRTISARILPSQRTGRPAGGSILTLMIWRSAEDADDAWQQVCRSYEVEAQMIKGRLELGF